ncbi:MAG: VWA-like domain-containing protein [Pseudomonadota bacterium]
MAQHSTRAAAALARLPEIDPAIAALALWCSYRDSETPTSTRGETILIGPEFVLLPLSEQTGLIAHHVMHVALRHSARRAAAQERYGARFRAGEFDLACDALVNETLLQGGHALPRPAVRAADLVDMLPPKDRPQNVLADWDCDRLYVAMRLQAPTPGSSEDGAFERYARQQGFSPDLEGSEADDGKPEVWSGRVEQAMAAGQRAGSGIGAVLTRFGDLPKATVPWEIRLRRMLNKALAEAPRLSHSRPDRAWLARDSHARETGGAQPVFEPGRAREGQRPRVVIGLDTSSSISSLTLDLFAAEAVSILRRTGAEAHLLRFDTEVHAQVRLSKPDQIHSLSLRQGGGTDFEPVFAQALALDPSLIVMLTDLDAPTPQGVSARVIWAVPSEPPFAPGFGEVLVMDGTG